MDNLQFLSTLNTITVVSIIAIFVFMGVMFMLFYKEIIIGLSVILVGFVLASFAGYLFINENKKEMVIDYFIYDKDINPSKITHQGSNVYLVDVTPNEFYIVEVYDGNIEMVKEVNKK